MEATPRPWTIGMPTLPALRTWWRNANDEDEIVLIYQQVTTLLNAYTSLTASHDRLVEALKAFIGDYDAGMEFDAGELRTHYREMKAALALARGEVE